MSERVRGDPVTLRIAAGLLIGPGAVVVDVGRL
jgi:hypothetical protein